MAADSSSEFNDMVDSQKDLDKRRRSLEINIIRVVLIISIIGLSNAALNSDSIQTVISWFSPHWGTNATILYALPFNGNNLTYVSTQINPTFNNTFIRFNVSFNDTDMGDWHALFICNQSDYNYTLTYTNITCNFTCGNNMQLCNSSNKLMSTDNPLYCDYYVNGYENQTQNFTAFIIDSGGRVVWQNSTFAVDRPPIITSIGMVKL